MERTILDEEKIRRAMEISQRRNQNYYTKSTARVNVNNKKDYGLFKRMILQIIICLLIYLIFYLITTTNYMFSNKVIETTNSILNYDINFKEMYTNIQNIINTKTPENNQKIDNVLDGNVINNSVADIVEKNVQANNVVNNTLETKKEEKKEEDKEKTVMEIDAENAKKICKFQKPLTGTITSEFGVREVIADGMTSDHKGIDIAAKSGTNIKAAMAGTVTVAEENSEYGKFIKITNGEVMTVYAHCKKIKVKVGDKVKIGQIIATVGSTGVSTGPHLHFEIRLSGRYINPKYVINF